MPWFAILCGLSKEHRREEHGMEQGEGSRKGKHLTREERVVGSGPPTIQTQILSTSIR
jgi:hypothetical protein